MNAFPARRWAPAAAVAAALCAPPQASAQVRLNGPPTAPATVQVMSWRDIPFRTVVRQQYDYSCGSAALATLLTYSYGMPTSEAEAFKVMFETGDQAKIRKVGFSMLDMKRYVDAHGLRAQGYRLTLDEIARDQAPVIALINVGAYRHFVVIKGVSAEAVLVGDPALGLKVVPRAQFAQMWNGVALQIERDSSAGRPRFNQTAEWTPWSRAPVRRVAEATGTVTTVTSNQFLLYQITPVIDVDAAGGS